MNDRRITIEKWGIDEVAFDDLVNVYPRGTYGVGAYNDKFTLYVPAFNLELIWHKE